MIRKLVKYYLLKTGRLQDSQFNTIIISLSNIQKSIMQIIKEIEMST